MLVQGLFWFILHCKGKLYLCKGDVKLNQNYLVNMVRLKHIIFISKITIENILTLYFISEIFFKFTFYNTENSIYIRIGDFVAYNY